MGGALGNPISEYDQNRINDTIHDVITLFSTEFSQEYTQAVIVNAKEEIDPSHERIDDCKLQSPPDEDEVLKSGMLAKRGDSVKSWKARFFVAYNSADNYKIDYHDGADEKAKLKGTIYCAGYRTMEFDEDDIAEHGGEKGIKLVPWSYRRRTWYMKCPDDDERKSWMEVFSAACYAAKAPHDPDESIAMAFNKTMRKLRWRYHFWGAARDAGPEDERLGSFILDLLDRDIVQRILDDVPSGPTKQATVDLVRKTIGGSVKAACSSAWTSGVTAVRSMSLTIQDNVTKAITPIVEAEMKFKKTIGDMCSGTTSPFLAEKGGDLLKPVLTIMFKPVTDSFALAGKGFHSFMAKKIADGDFAADKFDSSLRNAFRQMRYRTGAAEQGYDCLYAMCHNELAAIADKFVGGMSIHAVYNMCMTFLKDIMRRAVYTFGELAKTVEAGEVAGVLQHVTQMLFHDCMVLVECVMVKVFQKLLEPMVTEFILTPVKELVKDIQEQIEAIPGMGLLLDLPTMLESTITGVVNAGIMAVLTASLANSNAELDAASLEVGVSALAIEGK